MMFITHFSLLMSQPPSGGKLGSILLGDLDMGEGKPPTLVI